jgi:GNAT superfamily N-acetyltransferase
MFQTIMNLTGKQLAKEISIRRAERPDAPALLRLIAGLADFEKLPPPDAEAEGRLVEDGFGDRPRFESWLAFWEGVAGPVGYAILFETYSSFLARPTLYLEDIFVLPEFRRRGIGGALLQHCIRMAHERGCGRMEWTCLEWNTQAQSAYEQLGARRLSEWYLYRLDRAAMAKHFGQLQ